MMILVIARAKEALRGCVCVHYQEARDGADYVMVPHPTPCRLSGSRLSAVQPRERLDS